VIDVVKQRITRPDAQKQGWLLDGFPRTKAQARALADAGIAPDVFILLHVPDDLLVERVVGRRMDSVTGLPPLLPLLPLLICSRSFVVTPAPSPCQAKFIT
jgi:adenylate kinase family enzyme